MAQTWVGLWGLYVGVLVVTIAIQAVIGYWVSTHQRDRDGARWFLAMVGTGMLFGLSLLLFLLPIGTPLRRAAYTLSGYGALLTVWAFVVFVSTYTGNRLHRNRAVNGMFALFALAYPVIAVTNGSHALLFTSFTPVAEPFPHLSVERGPAFAAMIVLIQLPAAYGIYLMATHLLATRRQSGGQLALFIVGAVSIMGLDAISQYTGLLPLEFSHAAFGLLPFYLLTAVSLFRFALLDVKPVARNTVIERLRDPMLVVDDRGRVVDFNAAATHVWPDIAERIPADFETACPALAAAIPLPPTEGDSTEQLSLTYDGQPRHYSITASTVSKGDDAETGWYSILLRDITELERSRWQLKKQNERLDQVASTISHDLRNPINVATSHLELLEVRLGALDVDEETREELLENIDSVDDSTDRMQDIIDDILTIAREGKTVEETERVSLVAVAEDAWETVDTAEATLTVADDRTFQADRSKLLTIFENLFRNALDHGPADVTVTVDPLASGFAVTDDGPGIPTEHADNVFEYGYTTSEEGTGLGLSIVRSMAESHGWTVELDADHGGGARVVFDTTGSRPERTVARPED